MVHEQEVVDSLDALKGGDPEADHGRAEDLVMEYLRAIGHGAIVDAFDRARIRCNFWYA